MNERSNKAVGLARFKTGHKRLNGEELSAASRQYEKERNQFTRQYLEKIKGVNAVLPRDMKVRNGL
jgi:hypothetical protein